MIAIVSQLPGRCPFCSLPTEPSDDQRRRFYAGLDWRCPTCDGRLVFETQEAIGRYVATTPRPGPPESGDRWQRFRSPEARRLVETFWLNFPGHVAQAALDSLKDLGLHACGEQLPTLAEIDGRTA